MKSHNFPNMPGESSPTFLIWPEKGLIDRMAMVGNRIQLWFLELHDSPLELKGELQYLDENCHFRGEKMTILV